MFPWLSKTTNFQLIDIDIYGHSIIYNIVSREQQIMNIEKLVLKSFEIELFNCPPSSFWSRLMKMLENLVDIYNNKEHRKALTQ